MPFEFATGVSSADCWIRATGLDQPTRLGGVEALTDSPPLLHSSSVLSGEPPLGECVPSALALRGETP